MDHAIHPLSIPGICASAQRAAALGIPHAEANHFNPNSDEEGYLHAAFKGAYDSYTKAEVHAKDCA